MIFLKNRGRGGILRIPILFPADTARAAFASLKNHARKSAVKRATGAEKFFRAGCFAAVIAIVLFSAAFTGRAPAFPHTDGLYHTFCISPACTVYPLVVYVLPSRI